MKDPDTHWNYVTSAIPRAAGDVGGVELASFANIEAWYEACVKLVPNYEKANGEGAAAFGAFYKSKCWTKHA